MSFSHMTSDRFDDTVQSEKLGPGAYDPNASQEEVEKHVCRQKTKPRDTAREGVKENRRENRLCMTPLTPGRPTTPGRSRPIAMTPTKSATREVDEEVARLRREVSVLESKNRDLNDQKLDVEEEAQTAAASLKAKLEAEQLRANEAAEKLSNLEERLRTKDVELQNLLGEQQNRAQLQVRVQALEEELQTKNGEVEELTGAVAAANEDCRRAEEAHESQGDLSVRFAEMQRAWIISQDRIKELEEQCLTSKAELEAATFSFQNKIEDLQEALNLERILGEERLAWKATETDLKSKLAEAESAAASMEGKLKAVENDLDKARDHSADLQLRLESTNEEAQEKEDELQTEIRELARETADKQQEVINLKEEIEQIQHQAMLVESEKQKLARQEEELAALHANAEEIKQQNRELLESVQDLSLKVCASETENKELKESLFLAEAELAEESKQNAQLAGHNNHRQKIQVLQQTKDKLNHSRDECELLRRRNNQLEARARGGDGISEFVAECRGNSVSTAATPARSGRAPTSGVGARTPGRQAAASGVCRTPGRHTERDVLNGGYMDEDAEELNRKHGLAERRAEKLNNDYLHFVSLIKAAVSTDSEADGQDDLVTKLRKLSARRD